MIDINLNKLTFEVGEQISVSCLWTPYNQNNKDSIKLTVGWRTEGRGDEEKSIIYETDIEPLLKTDFSCQIPPAGPISYDGQLLRIIWEVNVIDSKRLKSQEETETTVFTVISRYDVL